MKYKHLWAWDTYMGAANEWKEAMQEKAARENAPIDCIFPAPDGSWSTVDQIVDGALQKYINKKASEL